MGVLDKPVVTYSVQVQENTLELQADRIEVCDEVVILHLGKKVVGVFAAYDYIMEKPA